MLKSILSENTIFLSNHLPLTMMLLEDWSFTYIFGRDAKKYLQSQLTVDINLLKKTDHTLSAHCNFKGKVLSTMRLFHYDQGYGYIQRKSVAQMQIKKLKKYSIFSDIHIKELNEIILIGIAGLHAKLFLLDFFDKIPNENMMLINENNKIILQFTDPLERFLLVLSKSDFLFFKKNINKKIFLTNSKQWLSLDIESGFPIIDYECSKKFTPQAINLDRLQGISFQKGCYYGQEMIARIFFKNLNKHYLCCLVGKGEIFANIGSVIEKKSEKKWHKIGCLLAISHVNFKKVLIQTVLYKPINENHQCRVRGFKNIFFLKKI